MTLAKKTDTLAMAIFGYACKFQQILVVCQKQANLWGDSFVQPRAGCRAAWFVVSAGGWVVQQVQAKAWV